jgi:hypothetical protein
MEGVEKSLAFGSLPSAMPASPKRRLFSSKCNFTALFVDQQKQLAKNARVFIPSLQPPWTVFSLDSHTNGLTRNGGLFCQFFFERFLDRSAQLGS